METTPFRLTRDRAAGLVSVTGLVLALVPLTHLFQHSQSPVTAGFGVAVPLLCSAVVVAAGRSLGRSDLETGPLYRILRWMAVGLLVGTGTGVGVIAHLSLLDYAVVEGPFVVANIGIVGATGGLLVGYYEGTGRQRAATIAENSGRFESVFEGTHDALVIADDQGTYVEANPAAATLFGVDVDTLVGMSIRNFADTDFDFDTEWSTFRQQQAGRGQFSLVRPDGTKRIVEFAATADIYPGHHLSALRDVTRRVTYEREIEHQRETLSFLNQILRHNVLNGIHVIHGRADFLADTVDDEQTDHVDAICDRSLRIADLVGRVNRLNDTMWNGDPLERCDVVCALESAVDAARTSFPDAYVEFVAWPSEPLLIQAGPMLEEVFDNLLVNAIRHNDAETPDVAVEVTTDDESVSVAISDNGPGIPDEKKEIVFGRGEKGPASDGTGFGLYIVNTLVDRYGGTVDVRDNDPRGSVFTLTFPRLEGTAVTPRKRHP